MLCAVHAGGTVREGRPFTTGQERQCDRNHAWSDRARVASRSRGHHPPRKDIPMSSELDIEQVDANGAIRETAHDAVEGLGDGDTRADFLKKAGLAGGAVVGGGALLSALTPGAAMAAGKGRPPAKFGKGDVGVLNFALTLEYLEAAFYNEATANQRKSTFIKDKQAQVFLQTVTKDENAHVAYLKKALGKKA